MPSNGPNREGSISPTGRRERANETGILGTSATPSGCDTHSRHRRNNIDHCRLRDTLPLHRRHSRVRVCGKVRTPQTTRRQQVDGPNPVTQKDGHPPKMPPSSYSEPNTAQHAKTDAALGNGMITDPAHRSALETLTPPNTHHRGEDLTQKHLTHSLCPSKRTQVYTLNGRNECNT